MVRQWIPKAAKAAFAAGLFCFSSSLFAEDGDEPQQPADKIRYRAVADEGAPGVPATVRAAIQNLGEGKVLIVTEGEEGEEGRAEVRSELVKKVNDSKYWIGVVCDAIDDSLKSQLGIDAGLVVQEVIDGGPAAKAGVKQYDVLIDFEGKKLTGIDALVDAVDARGEKEAKVYFYRKGKEGTLTITPVARPKPAQQEDHRHMKLELRPSADDAKTFEMMILRPGMAVPPQSVKIPDDVTIKFLKRGGKPGEFEIKRGDKTWTASEDKLDDLPEDVRKLALQIRGAHLMPHMPSTFALPVEPGQDVRETRMAIRALPPGVTPRVVTARAVPGAPAAAAPVPPIPHLAPPTAALHDHSRQLDEVNKKLDTVLQAVKGKSEVEKLHDEVERLRRDVDSLQRQLDRRDR